MYRARSYEYKIAFYTRFRLFKKLIYLISLYRTLAPF